jgi:hypothetical protein
VTPERINSAMQANERGLLRYSSPVYVASANGTFTFLHDLGVTPDGFIYNGLSSTWVLVQAQDTDRQTWTAKMMQLTGNADSPITVWAFTRL